MNSRPFIYSIRFSFLLYFMLLLKLVVLREPVFSLASAIYHLRFQLGKGWHNANFIPFKTIYYYLSLQENMKTGIENIGGNILLFLPFGIILPFAWRKFGKPGKLLLAAFICSLSLELTQLFFALGNFDVDDLLLNMGGALLGFVIFTKLYDLFPQEDLSLP